ncbi:MAG TPA: serine/threonine-protein kinase, partial [Polyangia bacterium]|nr:serine/threonine-protein kinase [Polyangia bacterium]
GGMGVVYLAEHPVIGRKVALKAIHPELSRNPEVVSRFITEAKSVNQIGNEHIVEIYDFGNTTDGEFYFIMEFLQGESLADKLKRERFFPPARALQVAAQVADALSASHSHGIIHRDLKPENIFLISRGSQVDFVKVLDFGLAKLTQGEEKVTHKTRTGSVMGTPYYMSPEQCEGKASIDNRADLYSLGVILFEMLTGRVPFGGDGYGEIIVKHITVPPPQARSINPQLSAAHEAILQRALAKSREDRFPSMADFRTAMLDPVRYLAAAPPMPARMTSANTAVEKPGAVPTAADDEVSGEVVFGAAPEPAGARLGPQPSTFRPNVGQLVDDEPVVLKKSRKGLALTALAAAVAAGAGGFYFYSSRQPDEQAPAVHNPTPTPPTPPPPVVAPPAPAKTMIKFGSSPLGATVTRKDTGEVLGKTPFEASIPSGKDPVEFVFKMANFEDTSMSLVPEGPSAHLAVKLTEQRPAVVEAPVAKTPKPRPHASTPKPPKQRPPRPVNDEDAVLEPSFK